MIEEEDRLENLGSLQPSYSLEVGRSQPLKGCPNFATSVPEKILLAQAQNARNTQAFQKRNTPIDSSGIIIGHNADYHLDLVQLWDGSVRYAQAITNGAVALGEDVVFHAGGTVDSIDHRDQRSPTSEKTLHRETSPIKILFERITDSGLRHFYIGGDRPNPTKIFELPADSHVVAAYITNTGKRRNDWIVSLQYVTSNGKAIASITTSGIVQDTSLVAEFLIYRGAGFWSGTVGSLPELITPEGTGRSLYASGAYTLGLTREEPLSNILRMSGSLVLSSPPDQPSIAFYGMAASWQFSGTSKNYAFYPHGLLEDTGTHTGSGLTSRADIAGSSNYFNAYTFDRIFNDAGISPDVDPTYYPGGGYKRSQWAMNEFILPTRKKESLLEWDTDASTIFSSANYNTVIAGADFKSAVYRRIVSTQKTRGEPSTTLNTNYLLNEVGDFEIAGEMTGIDLKYANFFNNKIFTVSLNDNIARRKSINKVLIQTINRDGSVILAPEKTATSQSLKLPNNSNYTIWSASYFDT